VVLSVSVVTESCACDQVRSHRRRHRRNNAVAPRDTVLAPHVLERLTEHLQKRCTTISSTLVYRDHHWVQLPGAALVAGDVVALRDGERAPARVSAVVDPRTTHSHGDGAAGASLGPNPAATSRAEQGAQSGVFARGEPVVAPTRVVDGSEGAAAFMPSNRPPQSGDGATGGTADAVSQQDKVLQLCGGMALFVLLETPAEVLVHQAAVRAACRMEPQALTHARVLHRAVHRALVVCIMVVLVLHALYSLVVLSDDPPSFSTWARSAITDVCTVALALIPMSIPMLLCIAEAAGSAFVMAVRELQLVRTRWKEWLRKRQRDDARREEIQAAAGTTRQRRASRSRANRGRGHNRQWTRLEDEGAGTGVGSGGGDHTAAGGRGGNTGTSPGRSTMYMPAEEAAYVHVRAGWVCVGGCYRNVAVRYTLSHAC